MIQTLKYWLLRGFILFTPLGLMACTTAQSVPTEVLVPLPVPCEVEQVEQTELPAASADAGIFELAQVAAARVQLLLAENTRLRAANNNPCPNTLEPAK